MNEGDLGPISLLFGYEHYTHLIRREKHLSLECPGQRKIDCFNNSALFSWLLVYSVCDFIPGLAMTRSHVWSHS